MGKPYSIFASICISSGLCWALLGPVPASAQLISEEAARACDQTTPDQTITSCSLVIDSGTVSGRPLAAAYAQRGYARTLKRNLAEAEADLNEAIKIAPDYAEGYANRANFLWTVSHRYDRALADGEQAVRLNPDLPIAHFVRAGAALNLGQYDRAIADYTETMKLRPSAAPSVYGPRGLAYHRKRDEAHAVADYSEILKIEPENAGMLLNRGDALRNMREWSRARDDYSEAIRLAPDNPGGWAGRGEIRLMTHDLDGAVADFSEAIRRAPDNANAHLNRAVALGFLSQYARALADQDMAIRLDPGQAIFYVNRAQTLNKLGDRVAATASLNKALQLAPGFAPALEVQKQIGAGGRKRGKPAAEPSRETANEDYRICTFPVTDVGPSRDWMSKVIDACTVLINSQGGSDENRALVHLQRGSMYRRLGKFELALADFSESIRHDPNSALAYTGRGNAYRGLKLLEQSIADHTEAIRLKPDDATTYNNRGNAWQDLKNTERAIADYDMAIKIDPKYATAYYNRGNSRLEAGDKDGAIADYRQAAKLNPYLKQATEMLQKVETKL
jgi:tetratricopeptide (TPR) repeat protein